MKKEEFRAYAHQVVDWMADYLEQKENYTRNSECGPKGHFQSNSCFST